MTVSPDGLTVSRVCTLSAPVVARAMQVSHDDPDVQPIIFAMHGGRDRVCWVPERTTRGVEGFIARRQNDPRLWAVPPVADWSELDSGSAFYISFISDRNHLAPLYDDLCAAEPDIHVVLSEDNYRPGQWWLAGDHLDHRHEGGSDSRSETAVGNRQAPNLHGGQPERLADVRRCGSFLGDVEREARHSGFGGRGHSWQPG